MVPRNFKHASPSFLPVYIHPVSVFQFCHFTCVGVFSTGLPSRREVAHQECRFSIVDTNRITRAETSSQVITTHQRKKDYSQLNNIFVMKLRFSFLLLSCSPPSIIGWARFCRIIRQPDLVQLHLHIRMHGMKNQLIHFEVAWRMFSPRSVCLSGYFTDNSTG